jgi:endo-1,4-beta-D-glucanase Y
MAQNKSEVKMVINWTKKHMAPERYLREMVCMWLCEGDLMNCFRFPLNRGLAPEFNLR